MSYLVYNYQYAPRVCANIQEVREEMKKDPYLYTTDEKGKVLHVGDNILVVRRNNLSALLWYFLKDIEINNVRDILVLVDSFSTFKYEIFSGRNVEGLEKVNGNDFGVFYSKTIYVPLKLKLSLHTEDINLSDKPAVITMHGPDQPEYKSYDEIYASVNELLEQAKKWGDENKIKIDALCDKDGNIQNYSNVAITLDSSLKIFNARSYFQYSDRNDPIFINKYLTLQIAALRKKLDDMSSSIDAIRSPKN